MEISTNIQIMQRNPDSGILEPTGETISTFTLARSMTPENFTKFLDEYLNFGGKGFPEGKRIGLNLRSTHRTLQRLAICFTLGLIIGLSEQEYFDARNEVAIKTAKNLADMFDKNELLMGMFI